MKLKLFPTERVTEIYRPAHKMRRNIMARNEYSKLTQGDEEIGCQFIKKEKDSHEHDVRKRLIIACAFCTVFIICEVVGEFCGSIVFILPSDVIANSNN